MANNKLYNLVIFIVFLLIFEFVSGLVYSRIKEGKKLAVKQWKKSVALNSLGYRDTEHAPEKKEGTFRIVVLGDSQAYGSLIDKEEDIFPRRLEVLLNQGLSKPRFEVINISKPGWGTGDQFTAFLYQGLNYDPDLVFVSFFHNDVPVLKGISSRACGNPLKQFLETNLKPVYGIMKKSTLFSLSLKGMTNLGKIAGWIPGYGDCLNDLYETRGWELQKIYFDVMDFTSRRVNFHLMVGILPFIGSSLGEDYPVLKGDEILKEHCRKRGIQCIDFYESGFKAQNPVELSVNFPDIHFNPYGADMIARIISDKLKPVKDRFIDEEFALKFRNDELAALLEPTLGPVKGEGNPLLQFKTFLGFAFDNQLVFADPLYFERSWIPYLRDKTMPKHEQTIYQSLKFFYLWRGYFDRLVDMVLNDHPTLTFVMALKRVYEEENEKELLDRLNARFDYDKVDGA